MFGYLRFSYHNRCFNDTIFNHNLHIQEFARIYLYCHCYIRVIVIQFFEIFIWLILDLLSEIMIKNGIIEASIVVRKSKIHPITGPQQSRKSIKEMQFYEIYKGHIKFQVISNLKSCVIRKDISAFVSYTILFSLLLFLINGSANR